MGQNEGRLSDFWDFTGEDCRSICFIFHETGKNDSKVVQIEGCHSYHRTRGQGRFLFCFKVWDPPPRTSGAGPPLQRAAGVGLPPPRTRVVVVTLQPPWAWREDLMELTLLILDLHGTHHLFLLFYFSHLEWECHTVVFWKHITSFTGSQLEKNFTSGWIIFHVSPIPNLGNI